ncbi:MAG: hypothetical protein IKW74_06430, partial [Thermoguttaceae bacterium]|nr:hypothetical protein [Thermoguttaceae bacterium]
MSFRIQYIATVLFFTELLFYLTVVPSVGADTQTESPSQNTLRYRFWMAPAEKIEQWPWDNQKYYPVHSDVFNQWVQQTQENNRSFQEEQPERQIREIHLTARLEGNCLIDGLGTFRTTPNVKTVTPLPLEPFSFYCPGILRPDGTWLYMGLYPDGKIYLTNPTGDTFTFPWTKQGKTAPNGDIIFDFDLVPSPVTELSLTVPRQYRLSSSTGILKSKNTKDDGFQEWQLNLGSNHHVRLTVSPDTPITDLQSRIGYRQKISYRFSLYGTEVVSHFTYSPTDKNLDDVIVILDQPLVPTAIEWGNGESGNTIFSCTNSLGTTRIRLRNPTPAQPAELKITGYCPLICDKEWRLPSVRILSDNLVWTETSANLLITEPLFVTELSPLESVQTFEPLYVHQENQNIYSFKYFQPNGGIAIKLQEKKSDVVFDSVTICSYNPVDVKARTTVFVRATQTGQSQFSLPVTQNWSIDAVQISTQEDFFWECTSPDIQGNKELKISMKTPVSQTDGLTLEINSRYSESLEKLEDVDHFSPIALGNILKGVHYLTFLTESPYKVSILTREGTPYTSTSQRILAGITGNEIKIRDLLASFTFNDIISLGEESVGCIARLEKKRSSCSTIIEGRISVQETSITESWKIKCTPLSGSRVDRLIVAFTDSEIPDSNEDSPENYLKTPWNWTLAFETDKSFSVEQLSEEEFKTLNLPSSMIAWEIQLLTSRSVPFEIRATRTTPLQRVRIVPLLFLPEMNNPQAEILVDSSTPTPVRLEAFQLSAITPELKKPGEYNRLIGCYQYIPDEFHHSPGQKLLLANDFFEPDTETDNEPLHKKSNSLNATDFFSSLKGWCWFTRCNTLYDANGFIRNHISLDMENHGLDSMTVTISDNVEPDSIYVWVNDKQINTHIINQRDIQIVLPEGNRFVHINIEYPLMENSLLQKNVLNDKIFTCNIPILSGTSNIWIPPTFTNNLTDESPLKQKLFREKIKT